MADAELVVLGTESTIPKVEQLTKAFGELESHRKSSLHEKTQWEDIREHFQNLEKSFKEKFDELEEKEKAFKEKQFMTQILIAEREAAVAAKERALLDRLQEQKDVAVSAIAEARKKCKVDFPVPVDIGVSKERKVSTIPNGVSNAPITAREKRPDNRSAESADAVAAKDIPRPLLKQLCEQMNVKGILKFISENPKHNVLRRELSMALKSASEPARLVLDSLEGFYPPDQPTSQANEKDATLQALRKTCLFLMESAIPLLGNTEPDGNNPVKSEIKQQAKAIADLWKPKLAAIDLDASNGYSLEAQAFLQLVAAFGIASDFDEDELCKLVLAISRRKQAPELCRSLGLSHKTSGVVEALVNSGRQIDAVNFAYEFKLTEIFAAAPLLNAFLNDLGKSPQETNGVQKDASSEDQELSALRAVIRCIEEYKLQEEYPLGPLQKRVAELKKGRTSKGMPEASKVHAKKPRFNAGYIPHKPAGFVNGRQHPHTVFDDRDLYGGVQERYPYSTSTYETPTHGSYGQQANVQRAYHYPAESVHPPAASYSAPTYGSFMGSGLQSASATQGNYGLQSASTNQGNYGLQSASANQGNYGLQSASANPGNYSLQAASANQGNYSLQAASANQGNYGLQSASVNPGNYAGSGYQPAQSNYGSYTGAGMQSSHQSYM